jgi:putative acetyltransferase
MIRPTTIEDIPRCAEINVFGWRAAHRGIATDEFLFNEMTVVKRMEKWQGTFNVGCENYVYDDGIVKGVLTVGLCRDEDREGQFELYGLYVDPCMHRQGIGRALVDYCEQLAAERGFIDISLWTFEQSKNARAFYEKMGFAIDGVTMVHERHNAPAVRYVKVIN